MGTREISDLFLLKQIDMQKNKKGQFIVEKRRLSDFGHLLKELDSEHLEESLKIEEKYIKDADEPDSNVPKKHPNRNLDKPDIDKPAYS